ncbi:MAG: TonB-dependent receptor [Gammaproteobacteria bacterium]|nr:TonB-dependent receptor [Gammaproteobacteria bacterium]MCP4831129.1 TonB-dependent receptor [Gammaproteobacteria bacterium]
MMKVSKTSKPLVRPTPVRLTSVTALVAMILSNFFGVSLAADDAKPEETSGASKGTDEIVVTATRRDTSIQEVPYNLSAISEKEIEHLQIYDLSDVARWTPGLIEVDQGARNANLLIMRGLNSSAINAPELLRNSQGDLVGTYYGETPVYIDMNPIDINRIEILRGPQGTLYGARSLGGTVKYIPNLPDTSEFTINANGRSYGMSESDDLGYNGSLIINAPLIEDTLALRAMLGYLYTPGFIDQDYLVNDPGVSCPEPFFSDPDCTPDDLHAEKDTNDDTTKSAGLALLWNITESIDATLSWRFQDQEVGGRQINTVDSMAVIDSDPVTPGVQPLQTGNYDNGLRFLEKNDRTNNIYNLTFNIDTDIAELVSTTSYTTYDDSGNRDQTDLLLLFGFGDPFPAFSSYTKDHTDDKIFTQELRMVSTMSDSRWDWIVGGFYQSANLDQSSTEYAPNHPWSLTTDDSVTYISASKDTDEYAFFGELGYQITDKWHVLGGARWFDFDDSMESCFWDKSWDLIQPPCESGDGDDSDTLFKLNTDYAFTDNMLGYALFSQGVGTSGVNVGPTILPRDRFIKPSSIDNYEVGVRSSWLDDRLTINYSVYYADWKNLQLEATSPDFLAITKNGGSAETKGIELETRLILNEHWSFGLGYAYTNAELSDSCINIVDWDDPTLTCPIYGVETEDGDRLPGSPEHQGNFVVTYNTDLDNSLGLMASYQMTTQSDVLTKLGDGDDCCRDFGESLAGFTIHSASLGLSGDTWDATLFADNMFNKYAETGVRNDTSFIGTDDGTNNFALRRYFINVITPRTIGIDFRYRFRGD